MTGDASAAPMAAQTTEKDSLSQPLLRIHGVSIHFGGIVALDDVSFSVQPNQILGLIGPNGAGKTTLFNCLSRLYIPTSGDIAFDGKSILDVPAHRIAALGIARTFQNLALFQRMSVLDNIRVGLHNSTHSDFVSNAFRLPWMQREEKKVLDGARELLSFLDLESVMHLPPAGLPFGTLKRVELARALAARPRLLLLDEPAGGLNHEEVELLAGLIGMIRESRGVTILLVEHHMGLVMQVSDHVVVLDFGRKIAEGPPAQVQQDPKVIQAYLGGNA